MFYNSGLMLKLNLSVQKQKYPKIFIKKCISQSVGLKLFGANGLFIMVTPTIRVDIIQIVCIIHSSTRCNTVLTTYHFIQNVNVDNLCQTISLILIYFYDQFL